MLDTSKLFKRSNNTDMKKVLNILTLREPAGVQQAEFLFRVYSKQVFDIKTVYLYDKVKNDDKESISLFDRRPKFFEMPIVFLRLVSLILRYKPDVVMCWGRTSNPFGVLASLFHKCKRVAMQSSASNNYKLSKGLLKIIGFIS